MTSGRDDIPVKEPVMFSKCNEIFETDSKYIQHYTLPKSPVYLGPFDGLHHEM
jgi:hypothetical protein